MSEQQKTLANLTVNSTVVLSIYIQELYKELIAEYNEYANLNGYPLINSVPYTQTFVPCKVTAMMPSSLGKF